MTAKIIETHRHRLSAMRTTTWLPIGRIRTPAAKTAAAFKGWVA